MSTFALCAALGGGAYAAAKLPANSVGARQIRRNAVGSSEVKNHSLRAKDFKQGQLPQAVGGAGGASGGAGQQGPPGAPATRYFATVDYSGNVLTGTATAARLDVMGHYTVRFAADISACTAVVTSGSTHGLRTDVKSDATFAALVGTEWIGAGFGNDPNSVAVDVVQASSSPAVRENTGFHIAVLC
jgi:hypothetical protein